MAKIRITGYTEFEKKGIMHLYAEDGTIYRHEGILRVNNNTINRILRNSTIMNPDIVGHHNLKDADATIFFDRNQTVYRHQGIIEPQGKRDTCKVLEESTVIPLVNGYGIYPGSDVILLYSKDGTVFRHEGIPFNDEEILTGKKKLGGDAIYELIENSRVVGRPSDVSSRNNHMGYSFNFDPETVGKIYRNRPNERT